MQLAADGPQKQRASSYVRNDADTDAAKLSQIPYGYWLHFRIQILRRGASTTRRASSVYRP